MDFETELGERFADEGGSVDEIVLGEKDEGGVVGIEGIFVVKGCAFLLGSSVEIAVGEIREISQLRLR